jgi:hypothetical protein
MRDGLAHRCATCPLGFSLRLQSWSYSALCRYGFGPAGWVAWVLAGAPAALRAAVARARGGGEDKGRWFAPPGRDQSPLSQAIGARGSIAARDMA